MTYLAGAIAVCYGLSILALGWNYLQAVRMVQEQPQLDGHATMAGAWPHVDVVIPVKDEADHIALCVESVLAQDYPNFRVIVVNDRSTDGTAEVLQKIQDRDSRLMRLDIKELPTGLFGKPHAVHSAAKLLTGEVVTFVDSDFQLRPNCLRAVVAHVMTQQLDWLAMMGAPELNMFWERLLVPLLGAMAYAWYDPRVISDPDSPEAIGSGFMCARRTAYDAIGGHGAVVNAYDEDSALLRLAKKSRQKIAYVLAPDLFTLRFYGGLKKTIHGMTRTCVGGIKTLPRMFITINALNFVALLPLEILAGLGIARLCGRPMMWTPLWIGMAAVHWLISTALCRMIYDRARANKWLTILHPLGAAMMIGICFKATRGIFQRGPITWRGTTY